MRCHSIKELIEKCEIEKVEFWQYVCKEEAFDSQISEDKVFEAMKNMYLRMKEADKDYDGKLKSESKMVGGDGEKMRIFNQLDNSIVSKYSSLVMEKALKMGESNACMKRIVAAPTAGSCGVIPAVLLSYQERFNTTDEKMTEALFVGAGIGTIIAENASISGASGGCQAEIGSAAAMAAGALVFLLGGNNQQISNAAALTLKSMLGLVCDPVCGLVEVPCIKRNVSGCMIAISSSQLTMAGIESAIPVDEVIDSMRRVGNQLPECLRETSKGGLATTRTAMILEQQMK